MNYIKNLLRVAIIATLALIAFGPPTQTQAAPSAVEPTQFSCANVTEIPQIECEALVALYNGTDGPNWQDTTGWLVTNIPCSSWYGVDCTDGHVTQLDLRGSSSTDPFGLQGPLPAEIGNFTNLTRLYLNNNNLSSLPAEIGNLTRLRRLELAFNDFDNLPSEIDKLTSLAYLSLLHSHLSNLPTSFINLGGLSTLNVSFNHLVDISAELQAFLDEKDPDWAETQTSSCTAETEISQIECEALVALYNGTDGPNWDDTTGWLVTNTPCGWYGVHCEDGDGDLKHVIALMLFRNNLQGDVPAEIGNLNNLTSLDLTYNQLNSLPAEIGKLHNLTRLRLESNLLSRLPAEIGNLNNLTYLDLDINKLRSLPVEICNLYENNQIVIGFANNQIVILDEDLRSCVTEEDPNWYVDQTVTPTDIEAVPKNNSIELTWTPITYQSSGGYYEISMATDGSFVIHGITNISDSRYMIDDLSSEMTYHIRIRTYTHPHPLIDTWHDQLSDYSKVVSATIDLIEGDTRHRVYLPMISR